MKVDNTTQSMTSSSEVLECLKGKKMDAEFRWSSKGFSVGEGKAYKPDELEIIKTFRFEGASDPGDSEIIYVIRTNDGLVGYSQDIYGAKSGHEDEEGYDNFIRQIPVVGHDEEMLFEL